MKEKLLQYIENHKAELFAMLCDMIDINTENHGGGDGNEAPLAAYLKEAYEALGVPVETYSPDEVEGILQHPDYLPGRNLKDRPNVSATLQGSAPTKSLLLAGHMDTVPVGDASLWTVPPVKGTVKDGWIWGRGANDDKFSLAVELFLAKAFTELSVPLKNTVYLGGYVDEEFGGGDGALALCLKHRADFAINMDSDYMDIIHCGVGGQRLAIVLRHPEPQDNCGIVMEGLYLAKREIDKFGARRCAELAENRYFKGTPIPKSALRYMNIISGTMTNDRHLGTLDFAFYTDRDADVIKKELNELLESIRVAIAPLGLVLDEVIYRSRLFRYAASDKEHPEILRLQKKIREVAKKECAVCGMCLSDLNIFINNLNGNAVSCGVCLDFSVEGGAHQPDERVSCDDLVAFTKAIASYILEWDNA